MGCLDRIQHYKKQQQRAFTGKYNCIPWPFARFRSFVPGTEKAKYIIVTAQQKIGKTKFVDFTYVYSTVLFKLAHPEVPIKIFYFPLENSVNSKKDEFNSFLLYHLDKIVVSPTDLNSTDSSKPISDDILVKLTSAKYQPYLQAFDECVTFIDDIKNPTGIYKYLKDYALKHGHINYTDQFYVDDMGNKKFLTNKDKPYSMDDEEEYRLVIIDNASNLASEKGNSKMVNIDVHSKFNMRLRDKYLYTVVLVQHQAQAQEGIENFKLNRIKPSSDGLADCKTTTRDANLVIGLYNPYKYGFKEYGGYNLTRCGDYLRFAEVIEDRDYGANGQICPLFFNGASSYLAELPKAEDTTTLNNWYKKIEQMIIQRKTRSNPIYLIKSIINKHLKSILWQ